MESEKFLVYGGQRGGGKILFLEQLVSSLREQLKATEVDRDRWKSAALYYRDLYIKQKQEENIMKQYIGTKMVQAQPAFKATGVRKDCKVANQVLTAEQLEDCKASGWEFTDLKEGYEVRYADGYMSWSPKDVFEEAYRLTDAMNFGLAIEAMKKGYRVARYGWNGKNMSVAYQKGYPDGIPCNKNTAEAWGMKEGELFKCRPYLQMRCADGTFQMWLASQSDILADDWYIVE